MACGSEEEDEERPEEKDRREDEDENEEKDDKGDERHGGGSSVGKPLPVPKTPSRQEFEQHMLSHIPYRSWCVHCVAGKSTGQGHRKIEGDWRNAGYDMVVMDYCYAGKEGDRDAGDPILVIHNRRVGAVKVRTAPSKGVGDGTIIERLLEDFDSWGCGKMVLRCDQEPSIVEVQTEMCRRREQRQFQNTHR